MIKYFTEDSSNYYREKGAAKFTANELKKNLEHEEICRSASIILKNISVCTKNDLNCETLFSEIGGFDLLLNTISKHKESEDICEHLLCTIEMLINTFIKAMENGRIEKTEKTKFINIIRGVMISNKSSRKVVRKCLSIFTQKEGIKLHYKYFCNVKQNFRFFGCCKRNYR